jgi:hypothetical protein
MTKNNNFSTQQKWNLLNPEVVKKSQEKYNQKRPAWSFRPTPELLEWLNEERWDDNDGNPETNAALLTRKLNKLMNMERQGY